MANIVKETAEYIVYSNDKYMKSEFIENTDPYIDDLIILADTTLKQANIFDTETVYSDLVLEVIEKGKDSLKEKLKVLEELDYKFISAYNKIHGTSKTIAYGNVKAFTGVYENLGLDRETAVGLNKSLFRFGYDPNNTAGYWLITTCDKIDELPDARYITFDWGSGDMTCDVLLPRERLENYLGSDMLSKIEDIYYDGEEDTGYLYESVMNIIMKGLDITQADPKNINNIQSRFGIQINYLMLVLIGCKLPYRFHVISTDVASVSFIDCKSTDSDKENIITLDINRRYNADLSIRDQYIYFKNSGILALTGGIVNTYAMNNYSILNILADKVAITEPRLLEQLYLSIHTDENTQIYWLNTTYTDGDVSEPVDIFEDDLEDFFEVHSEYWEYNDVLSLYNGKNSTYNLLNMRTINSIGVNEIDGIPTRIKRREDKERQ